MIIYSNPTSSSAWAPRTQHFTSAARRVLEHAQAEARRLGYNYIGTEHILHCLLHDSDVAATLSRLSVRLRSVRELVDDLIGTDSHGRRSPDVPLDWDGRARRVLEDLVPREVLNAGHHYAGVEHVFLGLIREGEGPAATVLASLGVHLKAARRAALAGASP
ncbi:hypothetical protein H7J06_24560 [Mycobacterium hodleri]|uniref:Clp protease N-terminal domain-containing protein n=1 Tax=Mycolicibacterium hodleri TaxID=49897 RepID=UPI0021F3B2DB|nr:Clp protease N-terminal domain-containing protein [Mycolicibacterium hodleri]MCV7136149.1 hypothetical protein [Mycolicibacterium hodleri]